MQYETHEQHIITQAIGLLERQLQARTVVLKEPDAVRSYLRLQLERQQRELFMAMYLDSQHRLIACETLFTGTLGSVSVYPREIVKQALAHNAASLILAHNHPSGMAEPSQADRSLTDRIIAALSLIDVGVLDHIVIGHGESVSFAERGWL
ncbi:RadC family protein [Serratia fonticola]|uniref:DNA repair protein RadC n=1 Tax=Serratia fonticola TaxID=47917 RepID=A0AAW3WK44_SERFO|nr:DNA repair protein RadC [Serratia fonticola]MBC3211034.1 DNA repair protein RadC [Serratia fonticola]NYA12016.1 DNA repair protein RadC [Serratia fonticola]NYA31595.1 DNA repair protein RadC [Serratia fonticola]